MKYTETRYLHYYTQSHKDRPQFTAFSNELANDDWIPVAKGVMEFDIDDSVDFTPEVVKALQEKKETLRAEMQAAITKIDERINSLLAIECKAEA